jgi:Gpi18-like mannosyltransferase
MRCFGKSFLFNDYQMFPAKGRGTTVKFSFERRELAILAVLLFVSFLVRVLLFPLKGYSTDTLDFSIWFNMAAQHGIRPFYSVVSFADYPPFNVYIFWAFGSLANTLGINMATMIKVVPNLFDLGTSALIFFFVRRQSTLKFAVVSTALYAFNPAVIFNTAVWGQFDAVYTFFLVLSLMLAIKSKPVPAAVVFALGLLIKPQGIALLPLVALLIYMKWGVKQFLYSVAAFAVTVFLVVLPFQGVGNPVSFLYNVYSSGYSYYHYTSINAFNLWGLQGMWINDGVLYYVGWALFAAAAVFTLYMVHKRLKVSGDLIAVYAAFMLFFAFFMLPTRIHERYLFPAISMLALMFPLIKKVRALYVALTATLFVNQAYVLYWLNATAAPNLTGDPVVLAVSVINLFALFYASIMVFDEIKGCRTLLPKPVELTPKQNGGGLSEL